MIELLKPDSWRYERKYFISDLSRFEIETIVKLHPAIFLKIYHERCINNIYFDSVNMSSFNDNLIGNSRRFKVRIRWYGDIFGVVEKPVLEIKVKSGLMGSKISYPLERFSVDEELTINSIRNIFDKSAMPDAIKLNLKSLNFVVLNCYRRRYFQSACKRFRITLDFGMRFIKIDTMHNMFLHESVDHINNVLELKYEQDMDHYAENITNYLPFRMTRSSKYIQGVERIF